MFILQPPFCRQKQITNETQTVVRTVEVSKNAVDYQSLLDEFENSELETNGTLTTFVGYKSS